jgi:Type I phosphodiesterase / nucleotide pyrophosphatase
MPACASSPATSVPMNRKLVLIVIDGLSPSVFEAAVESGSAPTLAYLAANGTYGRAVSTFPSLTPVCLASLATGVGPDVHRIPHLVWYHREERRLVEYGSSFAAMRAAGTRRTIRDAIFEMNQQHLNPGVTTIFEALEDAGLTTAAVNTACYRGRTRYRPALRGLVPPVYGPKRFFYYGLFESDPTGAPLAIRNRAEGSVDAYAAAVGRWLVTRDGFDFLLYYLPDYDFASHAFGPAATVEALARSDRAVEALMEAAGGRDEFLERYAVILCADHAQTKVERAARLQDAFAGFSLLQVGRQGGELAVVASNRAGMVYRLPGCRAGVRELAERLDSNESAETVLFREDGEAVARREGAELRFRPEDGTWRTSGDAAVLDYPDGLPRAWSALGGPYAGDLIVSAAPGGEFTDLAGRHHAGGGSHGSLAAGDSTVPMLTIGLERTPETILDVAPLAAAFFGVDLPVAREPALHAA